MKVVLFCGGLGTRIREYSESIPKPMVPIGQMPILWHIMNYYSHFGHRDFILCLGYKSGVIKRFFMDYDPLSFCDVRVSQGSVKPIGAPPPVWDVSLVETGIWRNIGGRLWAVRDFVAKEDVFLANYSDGLSNIDLNEMVRQFRASNKVACFLAVHPPITYHLADIGGDGRVRGFRTSDKSDIWINAGYFIMKPEIFDYMNEGEELVEEPFARLIAEDKLMAFRYTGFFRAMDTLRDRQVLEEMVERGDMPWQMGDTADKRP